MATKSCAQELLVAMLPVTDLKAYWLFAALKKRATLSFLC
jgi:hypothetical protein